MPRPRTGPLWVERIETLTEEGESVASIFRTLKQEAEQDGRNDYPGERTVRRIAEAHRRKPEHVRREAALFRWPRTMLAGTLPWEASRAALNLLRIYDQEGWGRPTVKTVRWFWRVSMAAPALSPEATARLSAMLQNIELASEIKVPEEEIGWQPETYELILAYQPWQDSEHRQAAEQHVPAPALREWAKIELGPVGFLEAQADA